MMNHLHQYNQNHWQLESFFSVCLVNCNIAVPSKEIYHSDETGSNYVKLHYINLHIQFYSINVTSDNYQDSRELII